MAILNGAVVNKDRDDTVRWLLLSHLRYLSLVAYQMRKLRYVDRVLCTSQSSGFHAHPNPELSGKRRSATSATCRILQRFRDADEENWTEDRLIGI